MPAVREVEKEKVGRTAKGSAKSAIDVDGVEKIESMVDEITILEAHVLNDVYGFQGVSEFSPFQGDARNQRWGIMTRCSLPFKVMLVTNVGVL